MRSFFFFFFWFLWIGGANVIPQTYFLAVAPEYKEQLVTLLLMLGSLASIAGIVWETKLGKYISLQAALYVGLPLVVISFGLLFTGLSVVPYFGFYLCFRFLSCALYQKLDAGICHHEDIQVSDNHAKHSMIFMLVAVCLAPVFFAFYQHGVVVSGVVILLAFVAAFYYRNIASVIGAGVVGAGITATSANGANANTKNIPLHLSDKYFLIYSGAYLAVVFLTSSLLVYFIRDFYGFKSPVKLGGLVMLVISLAAVVSCLLYGRFRQSPFRDSGCVWVQVIILAAMSVGVVLLYLKLVPSFMYVAASASLMGISYGVFVVFTRSLVVHRARDCGRTTLLAWYNMLPFISSIAIFAAAGGLKLIIASSAYSYYWGIAAVLAVVGMIALIALIAFNRNSEKC